jgi:deoxyadenosine/deoxycytidine kinase
MKKVNIQEELNYLEEKKISRSWLGINDGQAIKKTAMSEYVKDCYKKSIMVECHDKIPLKYKYYFDKKNWACILFTSSFIQDHNDENKSIYEADTIIVKIYISQKEFNCSTLILHIVFSVFEIDKNHWDLKDGYYETDCIKFNEFQIIKDIRRLPKL